MAASAEGGSIAPRELVAGELAEALERNRIRVTDEQIELYLTGDAEALEQVCGAVCRVACERGKSREDLLAALDAVFEARDLYRFAAEAEAGIWRLPQTGPGAPSPARCSDRAGRWGVGG